MLGFLFACFGGGVLEFLFCGVFFFLMVVVSCFKHLWPEVRKRTGVLLCLPPLKWDSPGTWKAGDAGQFDQSCMSDLFA